MRVPVLCLLLAPLLAGQTQPPEKAPETIFKVGADLVQLNISVFDPSGQILKGLPESAFTVYENNVKQQIIHFGREDVPVSLGLLIDSSTSMSTKKDRVATAALAMVKASNPDDEVLVMDFNEEADVVQDFTNNLSALEKSLRNIPTNGETAMRDAALVAMDQLRSQGKRDKKVLVIITDGEDNSSVATTQQVVERARHGNVIVYAIGLLGEQQPQSAARAKAELDALTTATGGRAWFLADVSQIEAVMPEIAHEIRNQYVITYNPSDTTKDGRFRTIRVEVNVPGATVRTRSGYYARP
jgi:Ca-activated chloride channel homolog